MNTTSITKSNTDNSSYKKIRRQPRAQKRRAQHGAARSEYDQKIISVRRVARVVAGGRRFSFSAALVLGNRKGSVGVGVGKGVDTALAIEKAVRSAKKNMVDVRRTEKASIPHEVQAKYCSSEVFIIPATGKGLVAGSSVRTVLDLAGVTGVTAKILSRSKNKLNNARATIKALGELKLDFNRSR